MRCNDVQQRPRWPVLSAREHDDSLEQLLGDSPFARLVVLVSHAEAGVELLTEPVAHPDDVHVLVPYELVDVEAVAPVLRPPLQPVTALPEALPLRVGICGLVTPVDVDREVIEVEAVQPELLGEAPDAHVVDEPALLPELRGQERAHRAAQEDEHAVHLRRRLELGHQVHVGAQVRGVDLEVRADGPLNRPAGVQSEAHAHAVVGKSPQELRVGAVLGHRRRLVENADDLHGTDQGQVADALMLLFEVIREAPGQEEGVSHVPVRAAVELVGAVVDDTRDAVHKDHDVILEDFRGIGEVPDAAIAEDGLHLPPGDHGVQRGAVTDPHVLGNDPGAGLPKAEGEERADLDDCLLQHHRLHGLWRLRFLPPEPVPHRLDLPPEASQLALAARIPFHPDDLTCRDG
mmetsp:Transcript_54683/g.144025  ORF Transcript_54683/g.144025 Transcript_54683/m.144025 type:complete len:404 (-) Transcript_54683:1144-2355(-)